LRHLVASVDSVSFWPVLEFVASLSSARSEQITVLLDSVSSSCYFDGVVTCQSGCDVLI